MNPEEVTKALNELRELEAAHGDAGVVAFILGIPVEDVLRVSGKEEGSE
jgi:hypothetical protein